MDLTIFNDMDATELREYVQFLLWHYRVMDSFWYLNIAQHIDEATADRLNQKVWDKVAALGARDLMSRFHIEERGLAGFVKTLRYWPWQILVGYQVQHTPDEVIITVLSCPTQEARLRRGLKEYHCREMHRGEFESFARQIDPRIQTECVFAPPAPHPPEMFCKWRFTLANGPEP